MFGLWSWWSFRDRRCPAPRRYSEQITFPLFSKRTKVKRTRRRGAVVILVMMMRLWREGGRRRLAAGGRDSLTHSAEVDDFPGSIVVQASLVCSHPAPLSSLNPIRHPSTHARSLELERYFGTATVPHANKRRGRKTRLHYHSTTLNSHWSPVIAPTFNAPARLSCPFLAVPNSIGKKFPASFAIARFICHHKKPNVGNILQIQDFRFVRGCEIFLSGPS